MRNFEVDSLTNMFFLAGPNGIGKSRLIEAMLAYLRNPNINANIHIRIEATSQSEKSAWGKNISTCLQNQSQMEHGRVTLQESR